MLCVKFGGLGTCGSKVRSRKPKKPVPNNQTASNGIKRHPKWVPNLPTSIPIPRTHHYGYDSSFGSWTCVYQKLDAKNTLFWSPNNQTASNGINSRTKRIPNSPWPFRTKQTGGAGLWCKLQAPKHPQPKVRFGKHGFDPFLTIKRQSNGTQKLVGSRQTYI